MVSLVFFYVLQDDELTILDVRKFKPIHKRKFNYEVYFQLTHSCMLSLNKFPRNVQLLNIYEVLNMIKRNEGGTN